MKTTTLLVHLVLLGRVYCAQNRLRGNEKKLMSENGCASTCTGNPCSSSSHCRSQWGFCGVTTAHCSATSQYKPCCNSGDDTPSDDTPSDDTPSDDTPSNLCSGSGWSVEWSGTTVNGEPPLTLSFAEVGQVWSEVNGIDACISAVTLSAGESLLSANGNGVQVRSMGLTLDPATQSRAFGIWQALPSWYCSAGSAAFPKCSGNAKWANAIDLPGTGVDLRDPCKQAYLTQRINKAHCGEDCANGNCTPWARGRIEGAGDFCNGGWTGNLPVGSGGQTCATQSGGCNYHLPNRPYYTNNERYVSNLGGLDGAKASCPADSPLPPPGAVEEIEQPEEETEQSSECPAGQFPFTDTPTKGACSCGATWLLANSGGVTCGSNSSEGGSDDDEVGVNGCPAGQFPFADTPAKGTCSCGTTWAAANSGDVECVIV